MIDNAAVDGVRLFRLTLSSPSGTTLGDPHEIMIEIRDNDVTAAGTASLNAYYWTAPVAVDEPAGTVTLYAYCGCVGTATTRRVQAGGSADFTPTSGTLTWTSPGIPVVTIPITDDAVSEGLEYFRVDLSSPTGGATLDANSKRVFVAISDDESAVTGPLDHRRTTDRLRERRRDAGLRLRVGGWLKPASAALGDEQPHRDRGHRLHRGLRHRDPRALRVFGIGPHHPDQRHGGRAGRVVQTSRSRTPTGGTVIGDERNNLVIVLDDERPAGSPRHYKPHRPERTGTHRSRWSGTADRAGVDLLHVHFGLRP